MKIFKRYTFFFSNCQLLYSDASVVHDINDLRIGVNSVIENLKKTVKRSSVHMAFCYVNTSKNCNQKYSIDLITNKENI